MGDAAPRRLHAADEHLVTRCASLGSLGYAALVGNVVHSQNRRLAAARDALRASEERYRLIAENAADLIAMVDHEGRWLYASPSYSACSTTPDLAPGADAFRRAHPDDAERARAVRARVAATGKPREIALRLVDREGRVRQYKARVQALGAGRAGSPRSACCWCRRTSPTCARARSGCCSPRTRSRA